MSISPMSYPCSNLGNIRVVKSDNTYISLRDIAKVLGYANNGGILHCCKNVLKIIKVDDNSRLSNFITVNDLEYLLSNKFLDRPNTLKVSNWLSSIKNKCNTEKEKIDKQKCLSNTPSNDTSKEDKKESNFVNDLSRLLKEFNKEIEEKKILLEENKILKEKIELLEKELEETSQQLSVENTVYLITELINNTKYQELVSNILSCKKKHTTETIYSSESLGKLLTPSCGVFKVNKLLIKSGLQVKTDNTYCRYETTKKGSMLGGVIQKTYENSLYYKVYWPKTIVPILQKTLDKEQ